MTQEFRDLTTRLAKGLNYKGGSVMLITSTPEENVIRTFIKGYPIDLLGGICTAIDELLSNANDKDADVFRDVIKKRIIADEERRFQKKGVSEE